jgi:phosphopantothenoylcysteine decarboxylase
MAKVLLGVTGSVAAIRTPMLYAEIKRAGHQVRVVTTQAALYFFDPAVLDPLDPAHPARNRAAVVLDDDEWPGLAEGRRYERAEPVLHIELRRWAEVLVIAPLDANTLAKLASGLSDNCLTCVWRAWDPARPVILAPAMNTLMWENPLTQRHLRELAGRPAPQSLDLDGLVAWMNTTCPRLRVVAPQSKRLACGDVGVGAMAEPAEIVAVMQALLDHFGSPSPKAI